MMMIGRGANSFSNKVLEWALSETESEIWADSSQLGSLELINLTYLLQAFLDFRVFDFRDFRFNAVYNSILYVYKV